MVFRYWTAENLSSPLAGGATQIATDVFEDVSVDDLLQEFGELPPPFVLIAPVLVEGIDVPFYTRQHIDEPENWLRELDWFDIYLPAYNDGSWPHVIYGVSVDTTPREIEWRHSTNQEAVMLDYADQELRDLGWYQDFSDWFLPFEISGTAYSDTLCRLMRELQRHLLEHTIDNGVTWALWTRAEVLEAIHHRIDRFLVETGLTRRRNTAEVDSGQTVVDLPVDVMQLRRVTWVDGDGKITLPKIDPWALDNTDQSWEASTGRPLYYIEQPQLPGQIQLVPEPDGDGTLELSYVAKPATFDNCDPLPIPAMWVPYIKYGVLSDLLSKEGEANDPERALHFAQRWDEGVELGRNFLGTEI